MKRKRGAPIGNQNAYKHGFYSEAFRQHERENLDHNSSQDLADEIGLMRVATSRLLASLEGDDSPRDLQTELSILRAICLSALSINSMVRTRLMLVRGPRSWPPPAPGVPDAASSAGTAPGSLPDQARPGG
jgi:hypothetical protein